VKIDMGKAVAAGWLTYPEQADVKPRMMSRNLAQAVEAFDSGLAWRMYDNGASREQIARAVGCSRRGVQAVIEYGRNNR
jgi:DNA-binding transcriptional regulator LsrR (DeoR family)